MRNGTSGREARRAALCCALFLFFVSIHAAAQAQSERSYQELPRFHQINAQLFRGAQPRDGGLQRLAALGIRTVINLRGRSDDARREEQEAQGLGLNYFQMPMSGLRRPTKVQVTNALNIINAPENWPVFVHCRRGIDRTGMVIASYRVTHDGWTAERASREANTFDLRLWFKIGLESYINDFIEHRPRPSPMQTAVAGNL